MSAVQLSEIAESIEYGVTASASEQPVGPKFLRITDIQNGSVEWGSVPYCDAKEKKLNSSKLKSGDIVFARTGATTGKSFLIKECPQDAVFASYLIRVRPSSKVDPSYLSYFFQSDGYWRQIAMKSAGAAQPGVNSTKLKELEIPLPPLDEQKRIAAILDQADALRRLRQRAINRLNTLGQAIFHEMFGSAKHEELVELKALGEVKTGTTPSTKIAEYFDGEIPFITPGDLETNRPVARYLSALGAEKSRSVSAGSTLVCCIGATIGKTDIAREDCTFNQQINAVEWGDKILPDYGYYAIRQLRPEIERIGRGASTTLPILKKSLFQELRIPVANRAKQEEFGDRIRAVEKQKSAYALGESFTAKLFSSLQHRAFQGGL